MSDPAIAALIREVLAEELGKLGAAKAPDGAGKAVQHQREAVAIRSDDDLARFVAKVLKYAENPKTRKDMLQGRLAFELDGQAGHSPSGNDQSQSRSAGGDEVVSIASGMVSERHVDRLPKATKRVLLGKAAKLTPLARDRLSHRGIRIERT